MFEIFNELLNRISDWRIGEGDEIVRCSMSETYSNIDFKLDGETYLLTIMKEEKKDDSVRTDDRV